MKNVWVVSLNEDLHEIVFAENKQEAARIGACLLDSHPECVELEEKAEYNQYVDLGYIPSDVIYRDGLWNCCQNCYQDIVLEKGNPEPANLKDHIFAGELAFCDAQCKEEWEQDQQFLKKQIVKEQNFLLRVFPGIEFDSTEGGVSTPLAINFKFPGGVYTAGWCKDSPYTVEISRSDLDAWAKYVNNLPVNPMHAAIKILTQQKEGAKEGK